MITTHPCGAMWDRVDEPNVCPVCGMTAYTLTRSVNPTYFCENRHKWHIGAKVRREKLYESDNREHIVSFTEYFVRE